MEETKEQRRARKASERAQAPPLLAPRPVRPSELLSVDNSQHYSNHSSSTHDRPHAQVLDWLDPSLSSIPGESSLSKSSSNQGKKSRVASTPFGFPTSIPPPSDSDADTKGSRRKKLPSIRSVSTSGPVDRQQKSSSSRQRVTNDHFFQPFPSPHDSDSRADPWAQAHSHPDLRDASTSRRNGRERTSSLLSAKSGLSRRTRDRVKSTTGTASESGVSVLSAFQPRGPGVRSDARDEKERENHRATKKQTDSPLRQWARWMNESGRGGSMLPVALAFVLLVKWATGVGSYSGAKTPPLRGDFEAQRHWLALTSSSLTSSTFHPTSPEVVPHSQWYYRDLPYWGLDYPPLTAYHSLLLGSIAKFSPQTAPFVTLRPHSSEGPEALNEWSQKMTRLEEEGDMKSWMRGTVVWSDAIVWVSAVVVYCRKNFGKRGGEKGLQIMTVAALTILLQPALLLIDNGHFQYNSVMLGFTLWSVNLFQSNHHLLGAVAFVLSLGFKQMALYYSPAIFAYLLGRCFWLGGQQGFSFLVRLGLVTITSFVVLLLPFLNPPSLLGQVAFRVFPFARGLFEDKVANVWCAVNIVIKLRNVASVATLAKLALVATLIAVLPGTVGMIWVSRQAGLRDSEEGKQKKDDEPTPTTILLPHALFTSAMAFFLFSFQVHEKSILLPLMPLTILMGGREAGFGRMDWEWAVLLNNVGTFSMWPLLKRDGLGVQYIVLTLLWNVLLGYNPFALRTSFVKNLSLLVYAVIGGLHLLELIASPPAHLPDLFAVFNLTLSVTVFGIGFLWATKRSVQEGWVVSTFSAGPLK